MAMQPQNARDIDFIDYILDTYTENDEDFPPTIWAEFLTSTIRTTNNCEAIHRKLNSLLNSSRPNIFNFIKVLKNIQCETYNYINLQSHGEKSRTTVEKKYLVNKNETVDN